MLTVGYGALLFTAAILVLVAVLLSVRALLLPSRKVRVVINDDTHSALQVNGGATLLDTLAAHAIYLPSGCGGKGSCGTCRVEVQAGAGPLLPTEAALVRRRDVQRGVRLACQVKVRRDMRIRVPAEVFTAQRWQCRVRSNANVATYIKETVLELPAGEAVPFRAGGYVQIECGPHEVRFRDFDIGEPYRADWDHYNLWRYVSRVDERVQRAYSLANYPGEGGILILNVRIALPPPGVPEAPPGKMSSFLFGLRAGNEVAVSGPYGHFFARDTDNEMCFVGGGAGMAPMRAHIFDQLERLHTGRKITFWYGARSRREAFYVDDFDRLARQHGNFEWHLALSEPLAQDHWNGPTGFIHQVLYDSYLQRHGAPEDVEYYLCGPPAMIDACRKMLFDLGVEDENVMFDDFGG
jgi:Na+-transporting NADH:ubiquinone oxidoreductase subunit F